MRKNKYGNVKVEFDGHKFDSKAELERYLELRTMRDIGIIRDLELQPKFLLLESFEHNGKKYPKMQYIADFRYVMRETEETVVEDVKGVETAIFSLKMKIFLQKYGAGVRYRLIHKGKIEEK